MRATMMYAPVMSGSKADQTQPSRSRPTRSSACRRRASAGLTCGPTAARTRFHDVTLAGDDRFMSHVHLHGGPATVRRFLPDLTNRIWARKINSARVFDLELPLSEAADGYRAMNARQATTVLLRP